MKVFMSWRWIALPVAFGLGVPVVRAEWITPDSIPKPPQAVNSANGTWVYANSFVTTQYSGLGLNFNGAAIAKLNGTSAWVPSGGIAVGNPAPAGIIDYASGMRGNLLSPGSLNPMTVSSLTVEIVGNGASPLPALLMSVYGRNGQILPITPLIGSIAGQQDWTFSGAGISSFTVSPPDLDPLPNNISPPWGVSGISFTPVSTPEPSSLVLAGLGALGLATHWRRRRLGRVACSAPAVPPALHL